MSLKNRIGVTQQVMLDLNPADSVEGPSMETAYGYRSRTSSFAAVATAVFNMPGYMATYSYIDSDGGLHAGHSKTMMRNLLCSSIALDGDENSMKPAARLSLKRHSN